MKAGWQTKKLGEISSIELGKTPSRSDKSLWDENRISNNVWLSIADLLNTDGNVVFDSKEYVSDKGAALSKTVLKGTLLVSFKLTLGRLAFAGRDLFTNEAIAALSIFNEKELSKEFLFYFLHHFDWVKAAENDAKIKGMTLNKAKLKELAIYYPSFQEQQRIVAILDQAFEGIAKARANAEQNLQNAQNIYMSVLDKLFSDLGDSTKPDELRNYVEVLTDYHANGSYETLKQNVELKESEDYAWMVRSTDFENNFENDKRYIDKHAYDYLTKSCIFGGEIIMSKIGNAGKVYLMPDITRPCSLAMNLFLIRLNAKLSSKFAYYFLKTSNGTNQIKSRLQGAATQTITKENVRNLLIPVCSQEQQTEIVSKIESLSIETQRLEALYQRKIDLLDELKKSLLQQAFAGEL